jgi:GT2 family glycosyltransferase
VAALTAFDHRRFRQLGRRFLLEGSWMHDEARTVDWAVGAALLMRRRAIDSIGPFDERFFMYVEDLDWCWRARERGWEIWFEPSSIVRHIGNASGSNRYGDSRTAAYLRNTYRWYRDARGPVSGLAFRGLNLAAAARLAVGARRKGQPELEWYWRQVARVHLSGRRMS